MIETATAKATYTCHRCHRKWAKWISGDPDYYECDLCGNVCTSVEIEEIAQKIINSQKHMPDNMVIALANNMVDLYD